MHSRSRYAPRYWPTWLAFAALWCNTRLPYSLQLAIGRLFGLFIYLFGARRRRITRTNLALCFPELTPGEQRRLAARHFSALGIAIIEIALSWWGSERKLRGLVTISGLEHLQRALQQGKGVLLLSAHFTTLEIGGRLLALHAPFHVLYRTHKNPVIDYLMQRSRTRLYEKAIERGDLHAMLGSLKQNHPVWYAPDQDFGTDNSIFVPFFGVPAATLTATSRLARVSGAPVVPFFPARLPGARGYELTLYPALEDFPGASIETDTARIMQLIEAPIREHPEQYVWAHRRFKTRPPGTQPVYDQMSDAVSPLRKILLITLSNIGDAVMTTPVMEALHARHPQAVLDIVTDPRSGELFSHCPYRGALIPRDKRFGWRGTLALLRELRTTRYDLVVDLRTDGLAWLLHSRRRLTRWGRERSAAHAVERHMGVIARREHITNIPPLRLWLSDTELAFARQTLAGLPGPRRLALGPGARWGPKRWPAQHFRELAASLREEFDALVLFGDQHDADCCREIAAHAALPCLNLAGKTTLLQSVALLAHMQLFIGNDSGLGHLAAAAGIPTLTLFGPGDPPRYRPWNPRGRWLQSPTPHLADLPPDEAAQTARALLADTP